jgi:hypothetical protein
MSNIKEKTKLNIEGHLIITDLTNNECILNKRNAINYENMSIAIASALAYGSISGIQKMAFGSGGVTIDSLGTIVYKPTNTGSIGSELYEETYEVLVSNDPEENNENNIFVNHETGNTYSDIIITATLGYNEPLDQDEFDNLETVEGDYIFNEIGLKDSQENLLTHIIFHPILKSSNRKIQIVYTIRIMVGA